MKIYLTENKNLKAPKDLLVKKITLICNGVREGIWVGVDVNTNKMYLQNHSIHVYPFPSWGAEFEVADELDITELRGQGPRDLKLTFNPEAWKELSKFLKPDGETLDHEKYLHTVDQLGNNMED